MKTINNKGQKGFTLLEILVAIVILGICLTSIMQLFSDGLRSAAMGGDYTRAVFHARSRMEEILLSTEFKDEEIEGTFDDGYRWQAKIRYVEPEEGDRKSVHLFHITVSILWGEDRNNRVFDIETLKIAKKSQK
ncbi:type II secretion system protein [Desulfobacterales bacterium HSG16]|nr:type II secretion system protein [Desulfobacterales bacterium HSG16]